MRTVSLAGPPGAPQSPGLPVRAILWEPQPGQRSLTVIVKATFALTPGEMSLANEQDRLCEERHWEGNALASLHWPGDFAPSKRKVDVTLVGHAYAPRGLPTTSLVARLTVGDLVKSVRVTGDRRWTLDPNGAATTSAPAPFVRMPLRYERAALSAENPVGIDAHAPIAIAAPALPNLERADEGVGTACFGPVAPTWRARRRLLDDAASFWAHGIARDPEKGGPPPGAAPARFDFAFFNAAPLDQQIDLVRAGMPVILENLHPEHERLEARVPPVRPQVFIVPPTGAFDRRVEEVILRCDSLWIDTDRAVVVLTWRGLAEVGVDPETAGMIVVAADPQGKKLRFGSVEKRLREEGGDEEEAAPPPDLLARRHDSVKGSRPAAAPVEAEAPAMKAPAVEVPAVEVPAVEVPAVEVPASEAPNVEAPVTEPDDGKARHEHPVIEDDTTDALARPVEDERTVETSGPPPKPSSPPPRARPSGLTLRKDLTLERCAEIAAALSMKGANRAALLRARLLTEGSWALVAQHWKKTIAAEAECGENATADAFDDAYVRALEQMPKPMNVAAYARLTVAVERGEVGQLLAELDLELESLVRLQRVWARRIAASPELADALELAVGQARSSS
jgi:hypothetical protein